MILDRYTGKNLNLQITGAEREKIIKGESLIKTKEREKKYNQKGHTIWITGLHGSGKNDVAYSLERRLFDMGATVVLLDGKSIRSGLSRELDYTPQDRAEHLRRIAHISKMLNRQGIITICSFISPAEDIRNQVAEIIGKDRFNLIYMNADIDFCRKNDKYGLYDKADTGDLHYMPGIDMEYDVPEKSDIVLDPAQEEENIEIILDYLSSHKIFPIQ